MRDDGWKDKAVELAKDGMKWRKIAKQVEVPRSTVSDFLRKVFKNNQQFTLTVDGKNVGIVTNLTFHPKPVEEVVSIKTRKDGKGGKTHFVIPDTQCKPGISLEYLSWIGEYCASKQPDVIVHLGDHADFESLSSYDKGKKAAEGKRVAKDIEASIKGMNTLLAPIKRLQDAQEKAGEPVWMPRMVLTLGNHEERLLRHVNANPELDGFLSLADLKYEESGWEVVEYLKPIEIDGISYAHFFANPFTGKPYGGNAGNMLQKLGTSFTQGHKQTLDIATRTLHTGKMQWGVICGSCYAHNESYKGPSGNFHFRGLFVKHNVNDGNYDPMFINLNYLKERYGSNPN